MKETFGYFQLGAKVTICSDAAGLHPRSVGVVKRHGNGAWRLAGCSEWYDINGKRVATDQERFFEYVKTTCWARPYQEGDEAAIVVEEKRLADRLKLVQAEQKIRTEIDILRSSLRMTLEDSARIVKNAKNAVDHCEHQLKLARVKLVDQEREGERLKERAAQYGVKITALTAEAEKIKFSIMD